MLSAAYAEVARTRGGWVEVVPVARLSRGHGLGGSEGKEPWVEGFSLARMRRGEVCYHPNAEGHRGVSEMVYAQIMSGESRTVASVG